MKNQKKVYKLFSTSIMTAMITVSLGAGLGQAEEINEVLTQSTQDTIIETELTEVGAELVIPENLVTVSGEESLENEEIKLLPGDFLYFIKALNEKIKLALAANEIDKAKLLVQYTNERINEAEVLFKNGEEELAYTTLLKALELQDQAFNYSDIKNPNENLDTNDESVVTEDIENPDEVSSDLGNEGREEVDAIEETSENHSANEENIENDTTTPEDEKEQLEEEFTQNVHGLLIAIQNVKNPTALKALTKNLEKHTKKFEKRYGNYLEAEKRDTKVLEEMNTKVEKQINDEVPVVDRSVTESDTKQSTRENEQKINELVEATETKEKTAQAVIKAVVKSKKEERKNEKEYIKNEVKQIKEQAKKEREQLRKQFKREKERLKEERKQQHKGREFKENKRND